MIFPRNFSCMSHNSSAVFFNETLPNRLAAMAIFPVFKRTVDMDLLSLCSEYGGVWILKRWGHPMCTEFDEHWRQTVVTGNKVRWVFSHMADLFDSHLFFISLHTTVHCKVHVQSNYDRYSIWNADVQRREKKRKTVLNVREMLFPHQNPLISNFSLDYRWLYLSFPVYIWTIIERTSRSIERTLFFLN